MVKSYLSYSSSDWFHLLHYKSMMQLPVKVIDNYLPKEEFKILQNIFYGSYMDWHCLDCINEKNDGYFQFYHMLYDKNMPMSEAWRDILPLVNRIPNLLSLLRIKANLLTRTPQHDFHGYHLDISTAQGLDNHKTAIYYCNTTNGYTQFEDGTKVEGIENRIVIFDGEKKHSSVSQTDEPYRVVINLNWLESTS